jgi:hypothetical protein
MKKKIPEKRRQMKLKRNQLGKIQRLQVSINFFNACCFTPTHENFQRIAKGKIDVYFLNLDFHTTNISSEQLHLYKCVIFFMGAKNQSIMIDQR